MRPAETWPLVPHRTTTRTSPSSRARVNAASSEFAPVTPTPSAVAGSLSRADMVERYARTSGRDVPVVPHGIAFSRWRTACIDAGVRARYRSGQMADDGHLAEVQASSGTTERLGVSARQALRELGL